MPPHEYTPEEVRERFLIAIWGSIQYWDWEDPRPLENEQHKTLQRIRLEGLAHSILALLDGVVGDMPGFLVAPLPDPSDRGFSQSLGKDWFPETPVLDTDIAGELRKHFYRVGRKFEDDQA